MSTTGAQPPLPLVMSVKVKNWREHDPGAEEADSVFVEARRKALERDDRTCRGCGFKAAKWQEVHHLNDDHADNRLENLVTACIYCHMVQHVGRAGNVGEAALVWLPEIPQDRLNTLVRTIQVAIRWADMQPAAGRQNPEAQQLARAMADAARSTFNRLRDREEEARRITGIDGLAELGEVLLNLPEAEYLRRDGGLVGLRMLPLGRRMAREGDLMPKIVESWMEPGGPYASMKPTTWLGILKTSLPG